MRTSKSLIAFALATAVLATACKKQDVDAAPAPDAAEATPVASAPATDAAPPAPAAPAAASFDIGKIAVSEVALPDWPYVVLPAGYAYEDADDIAGQSKDLARVPVWTGGQLLWVEGKVFSDGIDNDEGKTYSRFEVRKNVQQAVEALGGVRVAERSFDEAVYQANEKELEDFRQEFSGMQNAYWYDKDADTYVIRRADKAIWVVFHSYTDRGGLMVAEGPLPVAPAQ